jgi:ATP-dependent RNA helicase RhlE
LPAPASTHAIAHRIHAVALGRKRDALQHLLAQRPEQPTLIYTRTKHGADKIARVLERSGVKAAAIHGDKSQGARSRALAGFKSGELKALVITDIAARLLDAENLPLIISYDLPHITEDYTQRVSRTGSEQTAGLAITLITQEESPQFRAVRDQLRYPLELVPLPGFEAAEPFDPERDPVPKPGAEAEVAEAPAVVAAEPRRDGPGRGRRERRGRQGRGDARPREVAPPTATDAAPADTDELPEDAQPRVPNPIQEARPPRHERKPRPGRSARGERQPRGDRPPRGDQQPRGDRQPGFDEPLPPLRDDDDDSPGYGNSLAAPPPSQLVAGGPGRRRGRRDPFATVVVDENRVNIYDERQPDDYRDQWSVLGPDTNRPSWTYAEHQPQSLDAPPPRRPNPPPAAGRRGGPGAGPRGPQSGPRGAQRQGRPRRSDGR